MAICRVEESLRGRVVDLFAPLSAPGALPPGFSLAEVETEQGITLRFEGPGGSILVELESADASRPCFATTRRFNIYFSSLDGRGSSLPDAERALLERVVQVARAREGALPVLSREEASDRKLAVRELRVDRGLVAEDGGGYYLNPYVGCMLGCRFCYAMHRADFSRALEGLPRAEWGRWLDVKVNLPEVVRREVRQLPPGVVRISPIVTDPYQPVERRYRITRGCLDAMRGTGFSPVVLTRSSLVLEDLALLTACHDAAVGMSVPTDDDAVRAVLEPGTEPVEARVATLRRLHDAGITTFAVVQPMLPMDPARLIDALAPLVQAVRIGPLFEKERVAADYRRLGRAEALEETWERATFERLRAGFEARGVLVNPDSGRFAAFLR